MSVAAAASLLVFILIAIVTVSGLFGELNYSFENWAYGIESTTLTTILRIVSYLSEWFVYVPIALLLIAVPKWRWKYGIPASITLGSSALLNILLKHGFAIQRPDTHRLITETGFGFPSGHAMNGAAFVGICTLLFVRHSSKQSSKIIVSGLTVLFLLAVGFSRVYLGVHNPTDIIAGYAMGLFLCLCTVCVMDIIQTRKNNATHSQ